MIQFRSFRKISGLDTSELVTTGIYKWSRNPLYTGWFIWLLGISVLGQSGLALLLTGVFIIGIHLYNILLEEPYLERIFGEEFLSYKSKTPRYLGIPKR
jgi:protein-S-isoprenylcysteine O-methyltransferase Ste14